MSKRSERREAERLARKAAYKTLRESRAQSSEILQHQRAAATLKVAAVQEPTATEPTIVQSELTRISEAQLIANQANAQLSTGPITPEGKAISAKNALTHGLTCKTVVMPNEDADAYSRELQSFIETHKPANREELIQVEAIVDSLWRLARLRRIETGILRKGYFECEEKMNGQSPGARKSSPEVDAYLKYEKSIRNLHIQEARLQRTIQKAQAELARLQTIRRREEGAALKAAAQSVQSQRAAATPNGFVFSTPEFNPLPAANPFTQPVRNIDQPDKMSV